MKESFDNQSNLNIEKEENLLSERKHQKIQSFEIMNCKSESNKDFQIKSRDQTLQANGNKFTNLTRNTGKSEVIEEKIRETNASNNKMTANKKKNLNNLGKDKKYIYDKIPLNILKKITIIMIIIYIIIGIISIILFSIQRHKNPYLFCFNFINRYSDIDKSKEVDIIIFLTDLNSFCIIHLVLFFIFIILLFTLFSKREKDIKNFYKDFSIFFDLTLFVNIPIFILGILSDYYDYSYWKIICFIILTGLGTLFMMKIYLKTKSNKYKNKIRLINQGILSGILSSFELYCFIYNICHLITSFKFNVNSTIEIIPGSFYLIFGFFLNIFYKDIIFSITMLVLEIGLLYFKKEDALSVAIFNIFAVFFNFSSIILTIFKYNKKIFIPAKVIQLKKLK